ncbi:MAG: T9SS type A sorting domain-containing protein [Bacteroidetes bacterium]|nr:MAG: T9SS type A sorting domain-containing protein [Bacteroidota bacterium]
MTLRRTIRTYPLRLAAAALAGIMLLMPAKAQVPMSGSVVAHVDSLVGAMPGEAAADTGKYKIPSSLQIAAWGNTVRALLDGRYADAEDSAASIDYRIVRFTETTLAPSPVYYILEKSAAGQNYWGVFILNPSPVRRRLFIQSPHPKYDTNTGQQGAQIFVTAGARALYVSGTHRCNTGIPTTCSGTTSVCGGAYRMSDQAHVVNGPLYRATVEVNTVDPQTIVVQNHGFGKGDGDPDVIMGNGRTTAPTGTDWLVAVRDGLADIDNTLTFKVAHVDLDWTELIGTTNTQGRYINGSGNPCNSSPASANGRFLHIEQAKPKLRETQSDRQKLADAVAAVFPADTLVVSAASGDWSSASTWTDGVVPDSSLHVQIASGHTVTVTDAAAQCRTLFYADTTGHIVLAPSSTLSVFGDYTPNSTAHRSVLGWGSGAVLRFAGSAAVQTINNIRNNNSETNMSFFRHIVVDKSAGQLTFAGSGDSKLNITDTLEVRNGTFFVPTDFDINGRAFYSASDASPVIIVGTGGNFTMAGGLSQVMSRPSLGPVGTMTVAGEATLTTTSSNKINIDDIEVTSGGTLVLETISPAYLNADTITVRPGGIMTMSTTNNIWAAGSAVVLEPGAELRIETSTAHFAPVFENAGTVAYNRVAADGAQTVNDVPYASLRIASAGVKTWTPASDRTVSDTLEIAAGTLSLGSAGRTIAAAGLLKLSADTLITGPNTLSVGSSAAVTGSLLTGSGRIIGTLKRWFAAAVSDSAVFPVGTASKHRPVSLRFTTAPSSGGSVTASFHDSLPSLNGLPLNDGGTSIVKTSPDGFWRLTAGDGLTGGTYSITASSKDQSGISDVSTLRLLKRTEGGAWTLDGAHQSGLGTESDPVARRSGLTGFSDFAHGAASDNPMPAVLTSFTAVADGPAVIVRWRTASEEGVMRFDIERGVNGTWDMAGSVEGNGSSARPAGYEFVDRLRVPGEYRYRLVQVDRNGGRSAGESVRVTVAGIPHRLSLSPNFPNPFNPETTVEFTVPKDGPADLRVYSSVGQEVRTVFHGWAAAGTQHRVRLDGRGLSSGVYLLRLTAGGATASTRIILMK